MSLMKSISMAGIAIAGFAVSSPAVANASDNRVPVVYVVPMNGQMGTDIHPSIYDKVIEARTDNGIPSLIMQSGATVSANDITALRDIL